MVKKRYIWLSMPAFIILANLTMWQCLFPRKGCLWLMIKLQLALSVLLIGAVGIPVAISEIAARMDSVILTILSWVAMYFSGVLATHLLARWREKNISQLLRRK